MDVVFIVLAITILANLILGWGIFRSQRQSLSVKFFIAIIVSIISWSIAKILFYYGSSTVVDVLAIPLLYISGTAIAANFLLFAYIFPKTSIHLSKRIYTAVFLPAILFSIVFIFSDLIVGEARKIDEIQGVVLGPFYLVYLILIAVYFLLGHIFLINNLRKTKGILRAQFIYVLLGSIVASVGGTITTLLLPWFGNFQIYWLGPPATLVMIVFFSYSIVRHHLLDVRVIATELFTALVLITMLLNALLSETREDLIWGLGMFAITLVFGIFLILGTLREIRELERLSKAKSDLVSIVSHQLRTPLTAIKGFVSMIQEGSGTEEDRKDWLAKTYTTNERMIRLVSDILNISRIERGKLQYSFKNINILNLIEGVITEVRIQADAKNLVFIWERPSEEIPLIRADEEKLRQVILNLADNAVKYTEKGRISVRLTYLKDLRRIRIMIQDSGIGITSEELKGLFEQFSRGKEGQKTNTEGMGLGLYVAQSIVRAHNGKIWAESEGKGRGSRFYVELPVQ